MPYSIKVPIAKNKTYKGWKTRKYLKIAALGASGVLLACGAVALGVVGVALIPMGFLIPIVIGVGFAIGEIGSVIFSGALIEISHLKKYNKYNKEAEVEFTDIAEKGDLNDLQNNNKTSKKEGIGLLNSSTQIDSLKPANESKNITIQNISNTSLQNGESVNHNHKLSQGANTAGNKSIPNKQASFKITEEHNIRL